MYIAKEMKFPIFITLDESGVHPTGEQMYKLEIQDADLIKRHIESSDINYLVKEIAPVLRTVLKTKRNIKEATFEEQILEEEKALDVTYHESLRQALTIVNSLLENAITKSESPINNTYNLYIAPVVKFLLNDWLRLWDYNESKQFYQIAGNNVYIVDDYTNRIEKKNV